METAPLPTKVLASNLLFGILTFSCLHIAVGAMLNQPFNWHFSLPLILNGLCFGLTLALRKGKQWAQVLFLGLFLLITGLKLYRFEELLLAWQEHPFSQFTQTVYYLVMAGALLLLFQKPRLPAVQ